jgi:hypothetical protein
MRCGSTDSGGCEGDSLVTQFMRARSVSISSLFSVPSVSSLSSYGQGMFSATTLTNRLTSKLSPIMLRRQAKS